MHLAPLDQLGDGTQSAQACRTVTGRGFIMHYGCAFCTSHLGRVIGRSVVHHDHPIHFRQAVQDPGESRFFVTRRDSNQNGRGVWRRDILGARSFFGLGGSE